jgi:hypothetical protein
MGLVEPARGTRCGCCFSRERFANGLRVYGIDQDEQQEYAGRFCQYLAGSRVPIRTVSYRCAEQRLGLGLANW